MLPVLPVLQLSCQDEVFNIGHCYLRDRNAPNGGGSGLGAGK